MLKATPQHWLMKSEPAEASIDDLACAPGQTLAWTGVRNYQARKYMNAAEWQAVLARLQAQD